MVSAIGGVATYFAELALRLCKCELKGVNVFCPSCDKEINDEWAFCPYCGKAIAVGKKGDCLRTMQFDDGEIVPYDERVAHDFLRKRDALRQAMTCSINRAGQVANHKFIRKQSNSYVVVLTINDPQNDFDDLIVKECLDAEKAAAFLDEEMDNNSESHELYDSLEWVTLDGKENPQLGDEENTQCEGFWSMQFDDGEVIPYDKKKAREFLQHGNVPRQMMSCSLDREGQITHLQIFRTRFNTYFVALVIADQKGGSNVLITKNSLEVETTIDLLDEELGSKSGSYKLRDSLEWISLDDKEDCFGYDLEDYTSFDDYQKDLKGVFP